MFLSFFWPIFSFIAYLFVICSLISRSVYFFLSLSSSFSLLHSPSLSFSFFHSPPLFFSFLALSSYLTSSISNTPRLFPPPHHLVFAIPLHLLSIVFLSMKSISVRTACDDATMQDLAACTQPRLLQKLNNSRRTIVRSR